MATGNITIRNVEGLAPGATLWDAGHREAVRGFGVRCQTDAKTYILKYRIGGRQRFHTIGRHGQGFTPEKARKEAKRLVGLVADGKDPTLIKIEAKQQQAETLKAVIDRYLPVAQLKQKPRTYKETKRHLNDHWKPFHNVSVFALRRRTITDHINELAKTSGPVAAIHARAALSRCLNWAIAEGYELEANPVTGSNRPKGPKARERVLTDDELRTIWAATADGGDYSRIVRLLMLTGQRRDEVGGMAWVELDGYLWTIPRERTKNHQEHSVPLVPLALAQFPINDASAFVFGRRKASGFSGWSKAKVELDGRCKVRGWRLHDLRRTAYSVMCDCLGVAPHIAEAVTNHISGHKAGAARHYNLAEYLEPKRAALARWADHVAAITA
jgi:integrase